MLRNLPDSISKRAIFASMLAGHLTFGTRPDGDGPAWSYAEFAAKVAGWQGSETVSPRSVSNWCCGRSLPGCLVRINDVLFGTARCAARTALVEAFRAARQEKHQARPRAERLASPLPQHRPRRLGDRRDNLR
jgi:hypothetical protein